METKKEKKIEAIYPLTKMQQGLLFHHLFSDVDQGFLQLQAKIEGLLDVVLLKKAWESTIQRHTILRTTVHWKDIEKPLLVVRPKMQLDYNVYNKLHVEISEQENDLSLFKSKDSERIIDFEKGPLSKVSILKYANNVNYLVWNCHHLLLDGWSSSILLKDIFEFYDGLVNKTSPLLETVPTTKAYLNWLNNQDINEPEIFWKDILKDTTTVSLFNSKGKNVKGNFRNDEIILSEKQVNAINELAKYYKITVNSLFQGLWGILISTFFNKEKAIFGTTVSGRNNSFPSMDLLAGMFVNVLPTIVNKNKDVNIKHLLQNLQAQQQNARKYEHITIDAIENWADLTQGGQLFDSLFIFENYPWATIKKGGVSIKSFESGITTTYPITFTVKVDKNIKINIITNQEIINPSISNWFGKSIVTLLDTLIENPDAETSSLEKNLEGTALLVKTLVSTEEKTTNKPYFAAKNKTQLQLTEIWETVLGIKNIEIHDNFFKIGGKSLIAVKMFSLIESKLNIKLPPTSLLEHSTIASLAILMQENVKDETWSYLVPLRAKGNKTPLFCIHGGGGHVFFYNPLVNNLDKERPVYALQPSGLNDKEQMHRSIEEMAFSYVKEIVQVQPKGPYNLMVYCFSTAVGIEMAKIITDKGEIANLIVADSVIDQEDIISPDRLKMRVAGFIKRVTKNPLKGIKQMLISKKVRFIDPLITRFFGKEGEKNIEKIRKNLIEIYNKYNWQTKNTGDVSLILTKKSIETINEEYIKGWNKISTNPIKVLYNIGNHLTLFEGEDVKDLAKNIEASIIEIK